MRNGGSCKMNGKWRTVS